MLAYCEKSGVKSGPVFVTRNGKPLNRSNVWKEFQELCAAAHVNARKVFPHNFRHLFAVSFYRMEKDITKLTDLLGHASINTTRIYIMESGAHYNDAEEAVKDYLRKQRVKKLRDVWYQKTRTKDPSDWSDKYETPLLCMFGDAERPVAREMFRILMSVKPEESSAKKALDYLETATFYDPLSDETVRNKRFKERVVGDYAILLRDLKKPPRTARQSDGASL